MNRKPQPPHVLRSTRHLYGLSQAKLAAMVGCAVITIKNVENGTLRPSSSLAHQIFMQTGLNPGQLIENFDPETPRDVFLGEPLTKDYLQQMQKVRESSENREHVDASVKHLTAALEIILDASLRGHKLWAVRPALHNAIQKVIDQFDLNGGVASLLLDRWRITDLWSNASPESSFYTLANGKGNIGKFAGIRMRAARQRQKFHELQEMKRSSVRIKSKTETKSVAKPRVKKLPEKGRHSEAVPVASAA